MRRENELFEEFAQLRADFEEASKLLQRSSEPTDEGHGYGYGYDGQRWTAAAWAAHSQAPPKARPTWPPRPERPQSGVPVEGLPQDMVCLSREVLREILSGVPFKNPFERVLLKESV